MKTKHTPGPWTFNSDLDSNHSIETFPSNEFQVATIGILMNSTEADARAIAATPDLIKWAIRIVQADRSPKTRDQLSDLIDGLAGALVKAGVK